MSRVIHGFVSLLKNILTLTSIVHPEFSFMGGLMNVVSSYFEKMDNITELNMVFKNV